MSGWLALDDDVVKKRAYQLHFSAWSENNFSVAFQQRMLLPWMMRWEMSRKIQPASLRDCCHENSELRNRAVRCKRERKWDTRWNCLVHAIRTWKNLEERQMPLTEHIFSNVHSMGTINDISESKLLIPYTYMCRRVMSSYFELWTKLLYILP
jgi:hypothetical protein